MCISPQADVGPGLFLKLKPSNDSCFMIRGGLFMREYRRLMLVTVLIVMSVLVFSVIPQASQASDAWSV